MLTGGLAQRHLQQTTETAESHIMGGPADPKAAVLAHMLDWISAEHSFILRRALKWIFH